MYSLGYFSAIVKLLCHLFVHNLTSSPFLRLHLILFSSQFFLHPSPHTFLRSVYLIDSYLCFFVVFVFPKCPYLDNNISLHNPVVSVVNIHFHFPVSTSLNFFISLIPTYKKMIKNGKKKKCFLFSYVYITSVMYRKYIGSFSLPNYNLIR